MQKPTALTSDRLKQAAYDLGFHLVGIASLDHQDQASEHLHQWLTQGYHADMAWMANPKRADIRAYWPPVQSVIALGLNYYNPHTPPDDPHIGKIARYAWGRDYHRVLTTKLKALSQWLTAQGEDIQTRYSVDTGPIQDKVWAQRAGLGWIAKNSNLITRDYGSWVFLGEILINIPLESDRPHTAHCGTCTRCLEACPTGAIPTPFVVDANRCIAYHTIENREETLPEAIAPHLQGWVAGCDICQEVCPWNQRFAQPTDIPDFQPNPDHLNPPLSTLAQLTPEDWDHRFRGSALRRIKPEMWQRNARANLDNNPSPSPLP